MSQNTSQLKLNLTWVKKSDSSDSNSQPYSSLALHSKHDSSQSRGYSLAAPSGGNRTPLRNSIYGGGDTFAFRDIGMRVRILPEWGLQQVGGMTTARFVWSVKWVLTWNLSCASQWITIGPVCLLLSQSSQESIYRQEKHGNIGSWGHGVQIWPQMWPLRLFGGR